MKCPQCDNQLEGRQTYCSSACRKKASRNKVVDAAIDLGQAIEQEKGALYRSRNGGDWEKLNSSVIPYKLSRVDQIHEDKYPGYHIFGEVEQEKVCSCGQKFKTRLSLNRFCADCKFERV
jgi:hypothetical protein